MNPRLALLAPLLLSCGAPDSPAAEIRDGERTTYFVTAEDPPAEIRIHQSTEVQATEIVVEVFVFDADGLPVRVLKSGLVPPHEEEGGKRSFKGRSTFDGYPASWALDLNADNTVVTWRAPVAVELLDGREIELEGEQEGIYHETPDARRLEQARAAFARHDAELNRLYAELKAKLKADDLNALRDGQQEWLAYRDRWTTGGDDSAMEGPGSIRHTWRQAERTRDRVAYLRALERITTAGEAPDASGLYSDGMGNRLSLRFLNGSGPASFSLIIDRDPSHPAATDPYVALWGLARVDRPDVWIGHQPDCGAFGISPSTPPERINIADTGRGVFTVHWFTGTATGEAGSSHPAYEARYLRVANLSAATEPMGGFLTSLPDTAFQDLAEPLGPEGREELAATGIVERGPGKGSQVEKTGPDYLRLHVPSGQWTLRRFSRPGGSALLVLQTSNEESVNCRFWECDATGKSFTEVQPDSFLPEFEPGDFYARAEDAEAALKRHGHPLDKASWYISEPGPYGGDPWLEFRYPATPHAEGEPRPSHFATLTWIGTGFSFQRHELYP